MAHGIGKISGVLTKIGKFVIVLMYDVSIARLIPIHKLTFFLYYMKYRWRAQKKKNFFCQIGNFLFAIGKNILFGIGNGAEFRPQNRVIESPG